MNTFAYANLSPTRNIDPLGLDEDEYEPLTPAITPRSAAADALSNIVSRLDQMLTEKHAAELSKAFEGGSAQFDFSQVPPDLRLMAMEQVRLQMIMMGYWEDRSPVLAPSSVCTPANPLGLPQPATYVSETPQGRVVRIVPGYRDTGVLHYAPRLWSLPGDSPQH